MKKIFFALVLFIGIFSFTSGVSADTLPFTDVDSSSWYYDSVSFLYERGIISGTSSTTFSPQANIDRASFTVLLSRIAGADLSGYTGTTPFTDVASTAWYAPYVQWAYQNGYMYGTSSTAFSPTGNITRQQIAVVIYRLYSSISWFSLPVVENQVLFTDNSSISSSASNAVYALQQADVINGDENGNFNPNNSITRAELSVLLAKYYNIYYSEEVNHYIDNNQTELNAEISSTQEELTEIYTSSDSSTYFEGNYYTVNSQTFDTTRTASSYSPSSFTAGGITFMDGDIIYQQYATTRLTGHIGIVCGGGILECVAGGVQRVSFKTWKARYETGTNYVLRRIPSYCGGNSNCRSVSVSAAWYGSWYFLNGAGHNYQYALLPRLTSTTYTNCSGLAYKCYKDGANFVYKIFKKGGTYITPSTITPAEIMYARVHNGFSALYKF